MEPAGVVSEANWNSYNATLLLDESELMAQLLGTHPFPSEHDHDHDTSLGIQSMFWSDHNVASYFCSDNVNSSLYYWPQVDSSTSTNTSSFLAPPSDYQSYYLSDPNVVSPMDVCAVEEQITTQFFQVVPSHPFEDPNYIKEVTSSNELGDSSMIPSDPLVLPVEMSISKRKLYMPEDDKHCVHDEGNDTTESPKKKARASVRVQKSAKIAQSKKTQKSLRTGDEEENNAAMNCQSTSCYSSEDDSNASQELNGGGGGATSCSKGSAITNLSGKTRASRGSATDPQSLYARKRRERINERLRILQNLVPNGTKVDISTMLEEAVEYVKFLQLQIKLLSSDDLWMYAPLAYNGMDLGLDLKIPRPQQ